ncbi:MAG: type IX secretion system sortase PorU [Marinilabiliaceae bacterium]
MRLIKLFSALILFLAICPALLADGRAASSVLASGAWRKVSVEKTGVYRITRSQLAQMGFSDPASVRVYGAGGRQLSFTVGSDSRDDLYLLPAEHTADGLVFFAEGPDGWSVSSSGVYSPSLNSYSRKAYYYLTTGDGSDSPAAASVPDDTSSAAPVSTFDNRFVYATQAVNAGTMGRYWFSDKLTADKSSVTIPVGMACEEGASVSLSYYLGSVLRSASALSVSVDGRQVVSSTLPARSSEDYNYVALSATESFAAQSSSIGRCVVSVAIPSSSSSAYLGSVALVAKAPLALQGSELQFRTAEQMTTASAAVRFSVSNAPSDVRVWDVTTPWDPRQCDVSLSGGVASVTAPAGSLREYVAFSPTGSFPSPTDEGAVSNHDLHSHSSVNYLVVTAPAFQSYAERLCSLHSRLQGLSSRIVMVDDIYDEFSAGRAEATAIRDYIKMLYDKGKGTDSQLAYVLLLGAGSYDNFDRSQAQNVIPTYQSAASNSILTSYCTDDFFGWLDKGAAASDIRSLVRVGIGRIPCTTAAMAEAYTSKVEAYMSDPVQGDWRAKAVFIGQSGDENEHVGYAERQAEYFEEENPDMDVVRIFSESYTRVVSSTGTSYPLAAATAHNYLSDGCSLFHYTGHAGAAQTGEGYFNRDIAQSLTNGGKNFLLVAATCQFAPFDRTSGSCSQDALFNAAGGAIAVFASTRDSYGSPNYQVTRLFVKNAYASDGQSGRQTFGRAMMRAKVGGPRAINTLKYVLLGDPALVVSTPSELYVSLDSVNGVAREDVVLPVRALESSTVSCSVRNADGSVAESFSGRATVSLYDKRIARSTSGLASGTPFSYEEWGAKIFSGEVEVKDGRFDASFILSKEFDLSVGYGRLTAYAVGDDGRDALGAVDDVLVGGFADTDLDDDEGPTIKAWVDYERDADGNVVGDTPYLYAEISDEQGVNTSGQGVGHDISLVIDDDRFNAISLNDYFSYAVGSHTSGTLAYPLSIVAGSRVTLTLKACDNLNNSSAVTIEADLTGSAYAEVGVVRSDGCLDLAISTNAPSGEASVSASVYSFDGRLMASGSSNELIRNGKCDISLFSGSLPGGVYVLRCQVRTAVKKMTVSKKIFIKAQ